jgi:hypothetical protein
VGPSIIARAVVAGISVTRPVVTGPIRAVSASRNGTRRQAQRYAGAEPKPPLASAGAVTTVAPSAETVAKAANVFFMRSPPSSIAKLTSETIDGCGGTRFPAVVAGDTSTEQMRGYAPANRSVSRIDALLLRDLQRDPRTDQSRDAADQADDDKPSRQIRHRQKPAQRHHRQDPSHDGRADRPVRHLDDRRDRIEQPTTNAGKMLTRYAVKTWSADKDASTLTPSSHVATGKASSNIVIPARHGPRIANTTNRFMTPPGDRIPPYLGGFAGVFVQGATCPAKRARRQPDAGSGGAKKFTTDRLNLFVRPRTHSYWDIATSSTAAPPGEYIPLSGVVVFAVLLLLRRCFFERRLEPFAPLARLIYEAG